MEADQRLEQQHGVPERLTLGLTIEAMEALLAALPRNAVEDFLSSLQHSGVVCLLADILGVGQSFRVGESFLQPPQGLVHRLGLDSVF